MGIMSSFQHLLWFYFISGTLLSTRALRMTHTTSVVEKSESVSYSVMFDSLRPHVLYPVRLLCPWDYPGKNTGVGCHFLLQCMRVKSESEVAQSCPTLSDPMDCSPPGSSIHGILQARVPEWVDIAFSHKKLLSAIICQ